MSNKVINKNNLLSSVLEDSNRLTPFILALLDDLNSQKYLSYYVCYLFKSYTEIKNPKHVTVLCLEDPKKENFVLKNRVELNHNITLINEDDLNIINYGREFRNELTAKLSTYKKNDQDNVLVIDSIVPLYMSQSETSYEVATKNICSWIIGLHSIFSHIVFILHTDFTFERYLELSFQNLATVVVDFRLNSGLPNKQIFCPLTKLTNNSIHVHIIAKKKHPRTHLKVVRKHEHFQVDENTGQITNYWSNEQLDAIELNNSTKQKIEPNKSSLLPESTFNLGLKKDEQEAKDDLILPYMRKNTNTNIHTNVANTNINNGNGLGDNSKIVSHVVYHYDQFDDFDEDDPDDDLDI
ncbi:hypothetical protein BLOT_006726 [Blomia tropicalis]|nr:hypothetical protein BLOT_006726 [Blomia tropicalis]